MSSIDDRIVRLELQDSDFAKRLESDEKTLKKFNETLSSVGDSTISNNLQKITDRFSNLGIVGMRALENITDKAISTGEQLIKSLSVDNISSGWQKLQSQTKAVGTLSIQGYDMDEVNEVIKQLMWYSDETSYNFEDMLTSMTKFTAQGYGLKEAMETLEGIANWSAVAGQNAAAGSSAMTALSKAVGRGYLYQQDWSSLQTLMMDNKQVRQMILDTAVELGTLEKVGEGTYRSLSKSIMSSIGASEFNIDQFATYLTTGKWFTSDVLVATMKKYAEAVEPVYQYVEEHNVSASEAIKALNGQLSQQALDFLAAAQEARSLGDALESVKVASASKWQETFSLIFGDYERQKEIWTDLSEYLYDLFVESGNARNALLKDWAAKGGADDLIQGFYNIMDALIALRDTIKTAWQSVFPPATSEALLNFTEKFKNFTEKLILNEETATKLGRTLQGLFSILRLGKDILQAILSPIAKLLGSSGGLIDNVLTITQAIGDTITNVVHWIESTNALSKALSVVAAIIGGIFKLIISAGRGIGEFIGNITQRIFNTTENVKSLATGFKNTFLLSGASAKDFIQSLGKIEDGTDDIIVVQKAYEAAIHDTAEEGGVVTEKVGGLQKALETFGNAIHSVYVDKVKPIFTAISEWTGLGEIFSSGLIPGLLKILGIFIAFKTIFSVSDLISSVFEGIAGVLRMLTFGANYLSSLSANLRASAWLKYAAAIGIVVASLYALTKMNFQKISMALGFLDSLADSIATNISKVSFWSAAGISLIAKADITPVVALFLSLAAAIWGLALAGNSIEKFGGILSEVFSSEKQDAIFAFLDRIVDLFNKFATGAWAVLIPAGLLKIASGFKQLAKSLKGFINVSPTINVFKGNKTVGGEMLKFAASVAIVVGSIYVLANVVDPNELGNAFDKIGVLAGALAALGVGLMALDALAKHFGAENFGSSFLKIALALATLSAAVAALGYLNEHYPDMMSHGWRLFLTIVAITAGGAAIIGKTKMVDQTANVLKSLAGAFVGMGLSSIMIAGALRIISGYSWEDLGAGAISMFSIIAVIGVVIVGALQHIGDGKWVAGRLIAFAISFDLIAASGMSIASALTVLGTMDWQTLLSTTGSFVAALIGIAGTMALLNKFATANVFKNAGFELAILGFIGLLAAFSKVVKGFEGIDTSALDNATGAMMVLMGAAAGLMAAGYVLSKLSWADLAKGLVGIVAIGAVMLGAIWLLSKFAEVLIKFNEVDPNSIVKAGAALLVLGVAAVAITALGTALGALAAMAPEIAVIVVVAIAGIVGIIWVLSECITKVAPAIGEASEHFANAFSIICQSIINTKNAIIDAMPRIAAGIREISSAIVDSMMYVSTSMPAIGASIMNLAFSIGQAIHYVANSVVDSITDLMTIPAKGIGKLFSTGWNIVSGIAKGITGNKKEVSEAAWSLFGTINDTFDINSPSVLFEKGTGPYITLGIAGGMVSPQSLSAVAGSGKVIAQVANESVLAENDKYAPVVAEQVEATATQAAEKGSNGFWTSTMNSVKRFAADILYGLGATGLANSLYESAAKTGEGSGMEFARGVQTGVANSAEGVAKTAQQSGNMTGGSFVDALKTAVTTGDWSRFFSSIFGDSYDASYAAYNYGYLTGDAYGEGAANAINKWSTKMTGLRKSEFGVIADFADENAQGQKILKSMKSPKDEIKRGFNDWLSQIKSAFDDSFNADSLGLGDFSSALTNTAETMEDWQLSVEELVKKYGTVSESEVNGQRFVNWVYNGPMGGVIDEDHEWVYEGPRSGLVDEYTGDYLVDINGSMISLNEWTLQWQELYLGHAEYVDDELDSIYQNTSELNKTMLDQNDLLSQYNADMLSGISGLDSRLGTLDDSINNLGTNFSGFDVVLDSGQLVGSLSSKMDAALGQRQALVQRGVYR